MTSVFSSQISTLFFSQSVLYITCNNDKNLNKVQRIDIFLSRLNLIETQVIDEQY